MSRPDRGPPGVLLAMLGILAAYVLVHSPILLLVGRLLGRSVSRCYFACSGWIPNGDPAGAIAASADLLLAALAAAILARRMALEPGERLMAWGAMWPAFATVPAALIGYVGWQLDASPLRPPWGPLLAAVPAGLVLLARVRGLDRARVGAPRRLSPRQGLPLVVGATALGLLTTSAVISLVHPPTGYDALSYHAPLGVYYWRDGNIGRMLDLQPWAWALAHPGTFELWAGLLRLAGGERLADLAQLPLALLGAVAVTVFARRTGLGRDAASLGGLAFLLCPIVAIQSGLQLNDVTAAVWIVCAAALLAAPDSSWSRTRLSLVGLAMGLAVATKLATAPAVGALVAYTMLHAWRMDRTRTLLPPAAVALAAAVAPWWLRNLELFGNPVYPAALPLLGRGLVLANFGPPEAGVVPHPAAWPLYPILENHSHWSGFGALFAVAALPGLIIAARSGRRRPLQLFALLSCVGLPAWWFLTRHEPRFILYLAALGCGFIGWSLVALPRRHRRLGALVVGAAAVFSALVTVDEGLRPLAQAPTARREFYDRVWGVDSVASDLPEQDALLSHTGLGPLSYASDYPLLGPHAGRTLVSVDGEVLADSIVALMRHRGVRYAYVPATIETVELVRSMYPEARFELLHVSTVTVPARAGTHRFLFRLRTSEPEKEAAPSAPR